MNVRKVDLLSRDWCELVFEGRNKYYGAYIMRSKAGVWYCAALVSLLGLLLVSVCLPFLIANYVNAYEKAVRAEVTALSKLDPPKLKKDPELKAVATTTPVKMRTLKNAVRFVPEISNEAEEELLVGLESEFDDILLNETALQPSEETLGEAEGEDRVSKFPSPVEIVEEMPQFPGGLAALMKWLDKNVRYPALSRGRRIQGEVLVSFIVDAEGNVTEPAITQSVDRTLDNEALLAVSKMPKWTPGRVNGAPSCVRITIPIVFQLY